MAACLSGNYSVPQFPICELWMMTFCTLINVDHHYPLCAQKTQAGHPGGPLEGDAESHNSTMAKAG